MRFSDFIKELEEQHGVVIHQQGNRYTIEQTFTYIDCGGGEQTREHWLVLNTDNTSCITIDHSNELVPAHVYITVAKVAGLILEADKAVKLGCLHDIK